MEVFAAVGGGALLAIAGAPVLLGAAGFTSAGIAAGSLAAGVQAGIGNVVAGSTFAALQSAGAAGLAASTTAAAACTGKTAAGRLVDAASVPRRLPINSSFVSNHGSRGICNTQMGCMDSPFPARPPLPVPKILRLIRVAEWTPLPRRGQS